MLDTAPIQVAKRLYLVGLGNPGPEYRHTRHNLGFVVMDKLATELGAEPWRSVKLASITEARVGEYRLTLVKPQTYMNRSGQAVKEILGGAPPAADSLWLVYDDAEVRLGSWRIRVQGAHGGHNGVRSIIDALGSAEFGRVKIGIGPAPDADHESGQGRDLEKFVLSSFLSHERSTAAKVVDAVVTYLIESIRSGSLEPSTHTYQE